MLQILNIEPDQYSEDARLILKELGTLVERNLGRDELINVIGEFDVLIVRLAHQIDKEIIEAASNLKIIISATTGLDHIDLDFATQRNVQVLSLRDEADFLKSIPATAEHTWGLLLALTRNIPWAFASVLNGEWQRDRFKGHDLQGKRLGILGLGRIGQKVASFGLAFGMNVSAYDPYPKNLLEGVTLKNNMTLLLNESDILTIHVPLMPDTEKIIGIKELYDLPKGAYLINTSRGGVLDEVALLNALKTDYLAGAALDVISSERQFAQNGQLPLIDYARDHSNLLITPHIGGATYESMQATEIFIANKLREYIEDKFSKQTRIVA